MTQMQRDDAGAGPGASGRGAGTVEKAIDVLFFLHRSSGPSGVTAIGRALGIPKSTAHRLLAVLVRRGFVERDARGQYRPGIALVALGVGALEREPIVAAGRPILEAQAEGMKETLFLAAARGGRLLVLDKCEGPGFLRASPRVGSELPVHATAIGKIYLAFGPEQLSQAPVLEDYTERTVTDPAALAAQVDTVRARGWSESREEWIPGLTGIAAPVLVKYKLVGALAVSGPAARLGEATLSETVEQITDAAAQIGARLAGRTR